MLNIYNLAKINVDIIIHLWYYILVPRENRKVERKMKNLLKKIAKIMREFANEMGTGAAMTNTEII